ncbi:putative pentatricopeptide repeat-containing protein At1g69350, mitochondrial [Magnolia sinica]|uniref:putative pentatricopeptide repeat-containing protein At1g69350, mitochondrial n=1 Tax=Magnolia sinica TaxID=86752 RepID=UPI00265A234E|nr:putative pentatricopeptide repeat-containing protein At1g69350, mitochondrial [Magnolia sinica]
MPLSSWNWNLQSSSKKGFRHDVLLLYHRMLDSGIRPNASTFPSVLRSCADLSSLQLGKAIHAHILASGCHSDQYVASSLVSFYAKCQCIENARQVFDRMPQRSVVSWTALIQGYARTGSSCKAVEMFEWMQREDGIRPNAVTVLSLIPAASLHSHLGDGECIHACVIKLGFESNSLVATSLADMYLKCWAVENAKRVFYGLRDKNEISWLVMVSGLARNGYVGDAVSFVSRMLWDLNLILDSTALVNLIAACADTGDLEHGKWLHAYIIKTGVELDAFVGTALLDMYAKCNSLESAHRAFKEISDPNLVSWNAIMHTYAHLGLVDDVMELFRQLKHDGISPDSITMRSCLLAFASSPTYPRESRLGECFHGHAIKSGHFDSEIAMANSLLDFYAKTGNLKGAEELFSCIEDRRDVISWNCLINGHVLNGFYKEAIMLFCQMETACIAPDTFTLSSILTACASMGEQSFGQCMHSYLLKQGYTYYVTLDSFVGTALVDMYAKCGNVGSAYKVFEEISCRDTATWNAMIAGLGQNGYSSEALALFYRHLKTTGQTSYADSAIATAVSAHGQLACLEGGRSLHGHILRKGLESNVKVANAILSMYSKCGMVEDAESFFRGMSERDTTSWTTMIAGYGISGRVKDSVSLFEEMITKGKAEEGVEPNGVTFLEVLWACCHGGLVKEGWSYFERMRRVHRIEAKLEHYCCVVDLLGRGGYLYEAYVLVRSVAAKMDAAVWGALLGACRIYGELELGWIAGEELSRAVERHCDYHVLISNAYAADGWWEYAARVRKEAADGWRQKPPGWSRIEVRA